jgi:hypothetical protein
MWARPTSFHFAESAGRPSLQALERRALVQERSGQIDGKCWSGSGNKQDYCPEKIEDYVQKLSAKGKWNVRYFVLDGLALVYYPNHKKFSQKRRPVCDSLLAKVEAKFLCVHLTFVDSAVYALKFKTRTEASKWRRALLLMCDMHRPMIEAENEKQKSQDKQRDALVPEASQTKEKMKKKTLSDFLEEQPTNKVTGQFSFMEKVFGSHLRNHRFAKKQPTSTLSKFLKDFPAQQTRLETGDMGTHVQTNYTSVGVEAAHAGSKLAQFMSAASDNSAPVAPPTAATILTSSTTGPPPQSPPSHAENGRLTAFINNTKAGLQVQAQVTPAGPSSTAGALCLSTGSIPNTSMDIPVPDMEMSLGLLP